VKGDGATGELASRKKKGDGGKNRTGKGRKERKRSAWEGIGGGENGRGTKGTIYQRGGKERVRREVKGRME